MRVSGLNFPAFLEGHILRDLQDKSLLKRDIGSNRSKRAAMLGYSLYAEESAQR